MNSTSNVDDF